MPGGLGPRFVVEAGFLILLAVGTGLADLTPRTIIIVMGVAWLLVSLLEWLVWRESRSAAPPYAWPPERQRRAPSEPYAHAVTEPEALTNVVPAARARRRFGLRRGSIDDTFEGSAEESEP